MQKEAVSIVRGSKCGCGTSFIYIYSINNVLYTYLYI